MFVLRTLFQGRRRAVCCRSTNHNECSAEQAEMGPGMISSGAGRQ